MSIEKNWHISEYAEDIHNHLRSKEKKRCYFFERSHQLHARKPLVVWISDLSEKLGFCTVVKHLTIYFLDIFMDNHYCQTNHLQIVALGCLTVAAKVEEDTLTPRNSVLNKIIGNQYKLSEFVQMELDILQFFNLDVMIPTAAHFVEYYALFALSPTDTIDDEPVSNPESLKLYIQRYMEYFLDLTLLNVVFNKFSPSIVAAACILATRSCLSLSPPWPVTLQGVSGYKYGQVKQCVDIMLRMLDSEAVVKLMSQACGSTSSEKDNSSSQVLILSLKQ